jgi:hypothetical protein
MDMMNMTGMTHHHNHDHMQSSTTGMPMNHNHHHMHSSTTGMPMNHNHHNMDQGMGHGMDHGMHMGNDTDGCGNGMAVSTPTNIQISYSVHQPTPRFLMANTGARISSPEKFRLLNGIKYTNQHPDFLQQILVLKYPRNSDPEILFPEGH